MIKHIKYLALAVIIACTASSDIPSDFSVSYKSRNELMDWEVNISINSETLLINYKNKQLGTEGKGSYNISESEAKKIYRYMKSEGFLSMKQPEGERILDMPQQNLNGTFGGKTNSIDFGNIKDPPETLTKLKQLLFDLATKYHPKWKKDAGFE